MTDVAAHSPNTRTRSKRRWLQLMAFVLLVAIAAAAYYWFSGHRERQLDRLADPTTVDLPGVPDDSGPIVEYLGGPGAGLVTAVRAVDWGGIEPRVAACKEVADALDVVGSPTALRALTEWSPDATTGEIAQSFVDSSIVFVGACLAGDEPDPAEVRFTAEVWARRLEQLGL